MNSEHNPSWPDLARIGRMSEKSAQDMIPVQAVPGQTSPPGDVGRWQNLGDAKVARGWASGASKFIPRLADFFGGGGLGLWGGLRAGQNALLGGGGWKEYKDAFGKGFDTHYSAFQKYVSNPWRRLQMGLGGNAVKRVLDGGISRMQEDLKPSEPETDENGRPAKQWKDYREGINLTDALGSFADTGTEVGLSLMSGGEAARSVANPGFWRSTLRGAGRMLANPVVGGVVAGLDAADDTRARGKMEELQRKMEELQRDYGWNAQESGAAEQ